MTIEDAGAFLLSAPASGYVLGIDSIHAARCADEKDDEPPRIQLTKRMGAIRKLRKQGVLVLFTADRKSVV